MPRFPQNNSGMKKEPLQKLFFAEVLFHVQKAKTRKEGIILQGLIAVEEGLTRISEFLETNGYEVVELEKANLQAVDAVVVSGMDANLMNRQDILTEVPVVNAAGKSARDIVEELEHL